MKKRVLFFTFFLLILPFIKSTVIPVLAEESKAESEFSTIIDEQIGALDEAKFNELLSSLTEEQRALFGESDWKTIIKRITQGDYPLTIQSVGEMLILAVKNHFTKYIVLAASIIAIGVLCSLIHSAKSGFLEEGVGEIVFYAGFGLVLTLVIVACSSSISLSVETIKNFQGQMAAVLPVMLVLLSGAGGELSASVFSPIVSFLSTGMIGVFLQIAIPLLYAMIVLAVVGNLSANMKTGSLFSLFASVTKWILVTGLAVYSIVIGVQGITAAVHDGISYKLIKYTVGNTIPIVGGTIKDGFDMLLASCVTVKNAVGYFALLVLIGAGVGSILNLLALSWAIKASAGILQPIGEGRLCTFLGQISSVLQHAIAIVATSVFLYIITIVALISASTAIL